jgi:hypothetical protein
MMMERLLSGLVALPFLAGMAMAAQPVALNDVQMDAVTAGAGTETSGELTLSPATGGSGLGPKVFLFSLRETDVTNTSTVTVNIDPPCNTCYLNINTEAFTVQAQFGPTPGASNAFSFRSNSP